MQVIPPTKPSWSGLLCSDKTTTFHPRHVALHPATPWSLQIPIIVKINTHTHIINSHYNIWRQIRKHFLPDDSQRNEISSCRILALACLHTSNNRNLTTSKGNSLHCQALPITRKPKSDVSSSLLLIAPNSSPCNYTEKAQSFVC